MDDSYTIYILVENILNFRAKTTQYIELKAFAINIIYSLLIGLISEYLNQNVLLDSTLKDLDAPNIPPKILSVI